MSVDSPCNQALTRGVPCAGTATQPSQSQPDMDGTQGNSDDDEMDDDEPGPSQVAPTL